MPQHGSTQQSICIGTQQWQLGHPQLQQLYVKLVQ